MLYIISTPIGNLKDITYRAIEILLKCSYVLCEDTRISKILLNHYKINTPLVPFHKFNEKKLLKRVLDDLKNDKEIGLISDAGTPLISDPGHDLIKNCYLQNIKVDAIPGPCSIIQALVLSGFETSPFQFLGFLPKGQSKLNFIIKKMLFYNGTSIAFEVANRIKNTIEIIAKLDPQRNVALLKEMTKKFEMRIACQAQDLLKYLKKHPLKGELVIAIEKKEFTDLDLEDLVYLLKDLHGLSLNEAIKTAAKLKKTPKKIIYRLFKIK